MTDEDSLNKKLKDETVGSFLTDMCQKIKIPKQILENIGSWSKKKMENDFKRSPQGPLKSIVDDFGNFENQEKLFSEQILH